MSRRSPCSSCPRGRTSRARWRFSSWWWCCSLGPKGCSASRSKRSADVPPAARLGRAARRSPGPAVAHAGAGLGRGASRAAGGLRLRGSYLSLATLAFPLIALGLLFAFPDFSGGELGISGLRRLTPSATGNYYVAAVSMLLVVFGLWTLADSKFGLVLHAIR